ncbi:hypothetical protein XarjCFBP7645_03460 [Xanthomonas arboricola]|uniref:Uncharacterized protein n=1 Tax=Xanthomonas arboricola TaxID=56448 RepID=A0A2S7AJG6_9XANT|nr:hypothetical protein XarjCFBP7645_03460 [Xanthomonas arboricola]
MQAQQLWRPTATYVGAWHRRSGTHTRNVAPALHGASTHCARHTATGRRLVKNGGEIRSLNSR